LRQKQSLRSHGEAATIDDGGKGFQEIQIEAEAHLIPRLRI
jgi:hypothetical protein